MIASIGLYEVDLFPMENGGVVLITEEGLLDAFLSLEDLAISNILQALRTSSRVSFCEVLLPWLHEVEACSEKDAEDS
jgi:hypothetical protein